MATIPWGTRGYVKYYFVSRSGGLNDPGSGDSEGRHCFIVKEVQEVIQRHKEDAKYRGDMAHCSIQTCVEVPNVGEFWVEDFRPEWRPGTPLYRASECWLCENVSPRYQWSSRRLDRREISPRSYTCKTCGYDPADHVL